MTNAEQFISAVAPLARAEYLNRNRWVLPSVCIAQAALESGWNLNAKTIFGIKGNGQSLATTEYINGKYVSTTASFKQYPNLAAAVHGYYDLITGNSRYTGAVNNVDYAAAVDAIKAGGYATDPQYAKKVKSIIEYYYLTQYDKRDGRTNAELADEVIAGKWGNGTDRQNRLAASGYDYNAVQVIVNQKLSVANSQPVYYIIRRGDTLSGIAQKYGTTVEAIRLLNTGLIKDVNRIGAGWKIRVK